MAPFSSSLYHIDTPRHAIFPFYISSTRTPSTSSTSTSTSTSKPINSSTTTSPTLLLTTITCPISPPVPNRQSRRQQQPHTDPINSIPVIKRDEINLIPSRSAPCPPFRRTKMKRSSRRPMVMRIRFKQPEEVGLWVVWEDKSGEEEVGVDMMMEEEEVEEEEVGMVGLGIGLKGWDEDICSRFSSPSLRNSTTSLSSITDSLPTSVTSDTSSDEESESESKSRSRYGVDQIGFEGLFYTPKRKESSIEQEDTWEFAYALENPRTPLKSDFGSDATRCQLPHRTTSPGRRPPPLDLRVLTGRQHARIRLTLPSLDSPLTPATRSNTAISATTTTTAGSQIVTPSLSLTSSSSSYSHSSFDSSSPRTPCPTNRDDASKLVDAFASFLMSCQEDPLEYIGGHDTNQEDSVEDAFDLCFPSPPRRSKVMDGLDRVVAPSKVKVKSVKVSSRNGGVRSRSPADDKIRSSISTTKDSLPRISNSESPKEPLPPVPSLPEQYRKRSASSPLSNSDRLFSPVPRRTSELRSSKALQTVTGLLDCPSSPIARFIPLLESQADLQDSPFGELAPLNTQRVPRSFLPCPELLPFPTSHTTTSDYSSSDGSLTSPSSQRSSHRALPSRGSLPDHWRPSQDHLTTFVSF